MSRDEEVRRLARMAAANDLEAADALVAILAEDAEQEFPPSPGRGRLIDREVWFGSELSRDPAIGRWVIHAAGILRAVDMSSPIVVEDRDPDFGYRSWLKLERDSTTLHPRGALLTSASTGIPLSTPYGLFHVWYSHEAPMRDASTEELLGEAVGGNFSSAVRLAGRLRGHEAWLHDLTGQRPGIPRTERSLSGREWVLVRWLRDGHKFFYAPDDRRWAIGGPSGSTPESYEDGLLFVDLDGGVELSRDSSDSRDSDVACVLRLKTEDGREAGFTCEPFHGAIWLAWRLGMPIWHENGYGCYLIYR